MEFQATKAKVSNRGVPPDSFLVELVQWGRAAAEEIFSPNPSKEDVYALTRPELGPWESPLHRRAVMLEVMRVLAGFESSWKWGTGVDTTRKAADTAENREAGAWQVSYNSRAFGADLRKLLARHTVLSGVEFQREIKEQRGLAMEYVARLMRHTMKHNGPLYKERDIFPVKLQSPVNSIYPWVKRAAVAEFQALLSA